MEKIEITSTELKRLQDIEKSYEELKAKIEECYYEDSDEDFDADLIYIGEIAAIHFGFM